MGTAIDRVIDGLLMSGPLGILCVLQMIVIAALCKVSITMFRMYDQAQRDRIAESQQLLEVAKDITAGLQAVREVLKVTRP